MCEAFKNWTKVMCTLIGAKTTQLKSYNERGTPGKLLFMSQWRGESFKNFSFNSVLRMMPSG